MPSSIPFDPSLVLAQVMNKEAVGNFEQNAGSQATANTVQDRYNGL
jgi:hypothetical protein